mgnify:CR=1 FL=1
MGAILRIIFHIASVFAERLTILLFKVRPALAWGHKIDAGENKRGRFQFRYAKTILTDAYGDKGSYDRLDIIVHADGSRADSL